jgi:hypothetical protein
MSNGNPEEKGNVNKNNKKSRFRLTGGARNPFPRTALRWPSGSARTDMSSGHHEEECSQIDLFRLGTRSLTADHWCICPIMRALVLFPVVLDYMSVVVQRYGIVLFIQRDI